MDLNFIIAIIIVSFIINFVINTFMFRLEFKYNPWLFIDLYIGRKNFLDFYRKYKVTINNTYLISENFKDLKKIKKNNRKEKEL